MSDRRIDASRARKPVKILSSASGKSVLWQHLRKYELGAFHGSNGHKVWRKCYGFQTFFLHRMSRPRTLSPANFLFTLLLTSFVIATSGITTFQRDRRQFFTTCWGWGASCSMHGGTIYGTSISKPAQRREPSHSFGARDRIHVGIPSIVTSGEYRHP